MAHWMTEKFWSNSSMTIGALLNGLLVSFLGGDWWMKKLFKRFETKFFFGPWAIGKRTGLLFFNTLKFPPLIFCFYLYFFSLFLFLSLLFPSLRFLFLFLFLSLSLSLFLPLSFRVCVIGFKYSRIDVYWKIEFHTVKLMALQHTILYLKLRYFFGPIHRKFSVCATEKKKHTHQFKSIVQKCGITTIFRHQIGQISAIFGPLWSFFFVLLIVCLDVIGHFPCMWPLLREATWFYRKSWSRRAIPWSSLKLFSLSTLLFLI